MYQDHETIYQIKDQFLAYSKFVKNIMLKTLLKSKQILLVKLATIEE